MAVLKFLVGFCFLHSVIAKGSESRVECSKDMMKVKVPMDGDRKITYLDQMKEYAPCKPKLENGVATYYLDLQDPHRCGVTRVTNKITEKMTFYHKIVIEESTGVRETVTARCVVMPQKVQDLIPAQTKPRERRAVEPLPVDFHEPEVITLTDVQEKHAPDPQLGVVVKQDGKQVTGEISVSPGTPLSMEISLDDGSAPIYGLLVSYMHATDTDKQQETIIFNGCSVDSYVFDNFLTEDGDVLKAKFRAFKFPDTTYVQFKGTVTVCLDKCQGVQCSNGITGYGRKRRSIDSSPASNRVYEVALTTFIKVGGGDDREPEDVLALLKNLKIENQMLENANGTIATIVEKTSDNKLILIPPQVLHNNSNKFKTSFVLILTVFSIFFY